MSKSLPGTVCFFLRIFVSAGVLFLSGTLPVHSNPDLFQDSGPLLATTFSPAGSPPLARTDDSANLPRILSVTPAEITQGQTGNLLITGQHFKTNMRVLLGDGITTGVPVITNDNAAMATLPVTVSPSAPPGVRTVMVQYNNRQLPQNARITVLTSYQEPAVRTVTPSILHQGQTHTLTITGARLQQIQGLDLGPGITVSLPGQGQPSDSRIMAAARVTGDAAPGRRPVTVIDERGTHPTGVFITIAEVRSPAVLPAPRPKATTSPPTPPPAAPPARLPAAPPPTVSGPAVAPSLPPAAPSVEHLQPKTEKKILSELLFMNPHRWYPGKEYDITIQGKELKNDTRIDLGKDIQIKKLTVHNPSRAVATIVVSQNALPGRRPLQFKTTPADQWKVSSLSGMVLETVKPVGTVQPQPIPIPLDQIEFTKGEIVLLTPDFGDVWMMENWIQDTGIPTSNDAQVFTWQEKQVGTSQWFEIRILDRNGNIRVTRKIQGTPLPEKFYEPDVNFIMEIFNRFRPPNPSASAGQGQVQAVLAGQMTHQQGDTGKPNFQVLTGSASGSSLTANEQYIADNWQDIDCFWQVAGYKTFSSTSSPIEVAVSERWPLKLPEFSPTGLICSKANTQLSYDKVFENKGQAVEDNNYYVGDTILLSGSFSLDGCPWAIGYNAHWEYKEEHEKTAPVAESYRLQGWLFNNVFIDWGDGQWDVVYATPPAGDDLWAFEYIKGKPSNESVKPINSLKLAMTHTYRYAQKFPIRLFVLPESQVGMIDSICQANRSPKGAPAPAITQRTGPGISDQKAILLASSGLISSDAPNIMTQPSNDLSKKVRAQSAEKSDTIPGFNFPGSHAFLLYCEPKIIDIKADPASTGPIHLIHLEITEFSGQKKPSGVGRPVDPVSDTLSSDITGKPGIVPPSAENASSSSGQTSSNIKTTASMAVSSEAVTAAGAMIESTDPIHNFRPASDAVASSCDEGFFAKAALEYFGQGRVILIWKINGLEIARTIEAVGPSPVRSETDSQGQYIEGVKHGMKRFSSPSLPLDLQNDVYRLYELTCEAVVEGYEGVEPLAGVDQYVGGHHIQIPAIEYHGYISRSADPKTYRVEKPAPGIPCAFHFPVADGKFFKISNLQGNITRNQGRYSGHGTLYFQLPDSPKSMATHFVDIHFSNWEVPDNILVTKGQINTGNLNIHLDNLPGMTAVLQNLKGDAGITIEAVMDIKVKDPGIRRVGVQKPPEWTGVKADLVPEDGWYADKKSMPETEIYWSDFRISSSDVRIDLSRSKGERPAAATADSIFGTATVPFQLSSASGGNTSSTAPQTRSKTKKTGSAKNEPAITASVSQTAGMAGQISQAASQVIPAVLQWAGIHLGHADLYPYLFDLSEITVPADGWCITDNGISGRSKFDHFSYPLGDGSISFDAIHITAGDHQLNALYQNVAVHIPWPGIVLSGGNATLNYVQGQSAAKLGFHFNTQNLAVTENYGNISMTSRIKSFDRLGSGWGITTDTTFNFSDGRNQFATAELADLFFNVYGTAHFKGTGDAVHHRAIPLNQATTLGEASFTLFGLHVNTVGDMNKKDRIFFTFNGDIDFKELDTDAVDVFYSIRKSAADSFESIGPGHSEITVSMNYPNTSDVDALVHIDVRPEISLPGSTGLGWFHEPEAPLQPSFFASNAWASSGVQDTFRGEIDSKMFGNAPLPVKASFRYGKYNGNPYWLTHVDASPIDVMMFAGVHLKAVNGGLAHGFDAKVFENNPMEAIPNKPGATVYSAGIAVGSPDNTIYRMNGQLTVNPQDGIYRMAFSNVKLFGINLAGAGGEFQYSSRVFEGSIYGGFNLYNGAIVCQIPKDSNKVGLYFGSDKWEIWAGRKNNPVTMSLLKMVDTKGYLEFGTPGFKAGGGIYISTGKLCLGVAAGRLFADAQMEMAITTGHLDAGFSIGAGLDYWVLCDGEFLDDSISKSVSVNVSVPPLEMSVSTSIDVPDWIPGVPDDITLTFGI